jgi:preprotein translocase subunit SecG
MLIGILLAVQIIVSLCLIGVVLLQRSEGGGLVGGGGGPSGMMSVRGAGDLMTRTTWILGSLFFIISLLLTILTGRQEGASSVADRLKINPLAPAALATKPAVPPVGAPASNDPLAAPAPLQAPTPQVNNPFLDGGSDSAPAQK